MEIFLIKGSKEYSFNLLPPYMHEVTQKTQKPWIFERQSILGSLVFSVNFSWTILKLPSFGGL